MWLEFLVEEPSAEAALINLVPKIAPGIDFDIHPHEGKLDLLAKLPSRLKGYSYWLPEDWKIVVLIDEDREDCRALKSQMEQAAHHADLRTPGNSTCPPAQVVNRLAIEELEA